MLKHISIPSPKYTFRQSFGRIMVQLCELFSCMRNSWSRSSYDVVIWIQKFLSSLSKLVVVYCLAPIPSLLASLSSIISSVVVTGCKPNDRQFNVTISLFRKFVTVIILAIVLCLWFSGASSLNRHETSFLLVFYVN
jgi:hypothetical protein